MGNNYTKYIYVLNRKGANVAGNNLNSLPKTKKTKQKKKQVTGKKGFEREKKKISNFRAKLTLW